MKFKLLLIIIFITAFVLRFYQLGEVPNGLYRDETAIGYNAYSLIQTGKDEYGKQWPLYFKSFGDWKLPVYIYSTIVPIQLFGLDAFAVRFPSAFFGFLSVIIFYFFVIDVTKNKKLALVATGLLAINPWSLHYSRATFEVSIGLFFFLLGGYLLNKFFRQHLPFTFLGGVLCFLIALYSYNLTRLLAPLLFIIFLVYNRSFIKKASKKEMIAGAIVGAILLIPLVQTLLGQGGVSSASGTLIFSSATVLAPLHDLRWYANMLPDPLSGLFFNKYFLVGWQYLSNIAAYFSVPFFFITGSPHGNHGIGNVGLFYLFELPLVIAGVIFLIRKKIPGSYLLFAWAVIVILVAALTRDVPHATRSFFLVAPVEVFSAAGLLAFYELRSKKHESRIKKNVFNFFAVCFLLVAFYNIIYYFTSYYIRFPIVYARAWNADDRDVSLYLQKEEKNYNRIIFDTKAGFDYTSLLFYVPFPPKDFQQSVVRAPDDDEGFSKVLSFGKYEFKDVDWSKDPHTDGTLIVTRNDFKPEGINAFKVFYFPERYASFAVGQQIMEYPVHDLSYVLVKKQ